MTIYPDAIVTTIAIAEAQGFPDDELRNLAQRLRQGEIPTEPPAEAFWRIAASFSAVRRGFGRDAAHELVAQVFLLPEHAGLLQALHQVSPCIVPLDSD